MAEALHAEWTKLRTLASTYWLLFAVAVLTVGVSCRGGRRQQLPSRRLPGHAEAVAHRDRPRPSSRRRPCRVGDQQRVQHRDDVHHPHCHASPTRRAGSKGRHAHWSRRSSRASSQSAGPSSQAGSSCRATASPLPMATPLVSLGHGPTLRAAVGSVLYLVLIALLSLGVATAVRESAAAIGLVLGLLYLFPFLAQVVSDPAWHRHLEQIGSDDGRACDSSDYEPAKSAHQPVGWARGARGLERRRPPHRGTSLEAQRRVTGTTIPGRLGPGATADSCVRRCRFGHQQHGQRESHQLPRGRPWSKSH